MTEETPIPQPTPEQIAAEMRTGPQGPPPMTEEQQQKIRQLAALISKGIEDFAKATVTDLQFRNNGQIAVNPVEMLVNTRCEQIRLSTLISVLIARGVITDEEMATNYSQQLQHHATELLKQSVGRDVKGILLDQSGGRLNGRGGPRR